MFSCRHSKLVLAACVAISLTFLISRSTHGQTTPPSSDTTNVIVLVKEADSDQPISQAHLTLQFSEPVIFGRPRKISYNAKTDAQGRFKFTGINKGAIVLTVTAPEHQSYGKELQLEKDNQVFEVRLKKPQPLV